MSAVAAKLASLRQLMSERGYDAVIVPRADEYLGEYIPARNERLHWLTGFTDRVKGRLIARHSHFQNLEIDNPL